MHRALQPRRCSRSEGGVSRGRESAHRHRARHAMPDALANEPAAPGAERWFVQPQLPAPLHETIVRGGTGSRCLPTRRRARFRGAPAGPRHSAWLGVTKRSTRGDRSPRCGRRARGTGWSSTTTRRRHMGNGAAAGRGTDPRHRRPGRSHDTTAISCSIRTSYLDGDHATTRGPPDMPAPARARPCACFAPEFAALHERALPKGRGVPRVLVFLGGADAARTARPSTPSNLVAIRSSRSTWVGRRRASFLESIEARCRERGPHACQVQTADIATLIGRCRPRARRRAARPTWERCCLGLPTIAVCLADNPRQLLRDAAASRAAARAEIAPDDAPALARHVAALIESPAPAPPLRALGRPPLSTAAAPPASRVRGATRKFACCPATAADSDRSSPGATTRSSASPRGAPRRFGGRIKRAWLAEGPGRPEAPAAAGPFAATRRSASCRRIDLERRRRRGSVDLPIVPS
jgi:hypothetical protein